jgi:recombination protein RecA
VSKEGSLLDVGVDTEIVRKSGAWFTYEGEQLGQGRENSRQFLAEHKDIAMEIERKIREAVGLTSFSDDEVVAIDDLTAPAKPVPTKEAPATAPPKPAPARATPAKTATAKDSAPAKEPAPATAR